MEPVKIICVVGPTASGKTKRAVALAKERGGEVISVDSRQVYRLLNLGTEKTSTEEMEGIPHHLIDILDPKELYSAGDFVEDATRLIDEIIARGNVPILAGGTHFYFDALIKGLPPETPPNEILRTELERLSTDELYVKVLEADPERAASMDPKNPRRLVRALEIIEALGKVPARAPLRSYDVEWFAVLPEREESRKRIGARLRETLAKGLVEEVRRVREYVGDDRLNELGLEYRIIGEYLRGERDEVSLLPALESALFDYARRQEAWLRKLLPN